MKPIFSLLCLFLAIQITPAFAQSSEAEIIRSIFDAERKMVVENFLDLSAAEKEAFLPVYTDFELTRRKIADKRIDLLRRYADNYGNLSAEAADDMVKQSLDIQKQHHKMMKKYYKKMKKAIGPIKATSFVQLEEYIQTAIRYDIYDNIPFVGEY